MADEEIELNYFSPQTVTVPKEDHTIPMSGPHGHVGQTVTISSSESTSHVRTSSAGTTCTVAGQRAHGQASPVCNCQLVYVTHHVGALPVVSVSGHCEHSAAQAVLSPPHGTMGETHGGKSVTCEVVSPPHGMMGETHGGKSVTRAVITHWKTACNTIDSPRDNKSVPHVTYAGTKCHGANRDVHDVQPHGANRVVHGVQPHGANRGVHDVQPHGANRGVHDVKPHGANRGVHDVQPHRANRGVHDVQPHRANRGLHDVQPHRANRDVHDVQPHGDNRDGCDVQPHRANRDVHDVQPHGDNRDGCDVQPHRANRDVHDLQPHGANRGVCDVQPHGANRDAWDVQPHMVNRGARDVQPRDAKLGGTRRRTLTAFSIPHFIAKHLKTAFADDKCWRLQPGIGNTLDILQLEAGSNLDALQLGAGSNLDTLQLGAGSNLDTLQLGAGSNLDTLQLGAGSNLDTLQLGAGSNLDTLQLGAGSNLDTLQLGAGSNLDTLQLGAGSNLDALQIGAGNRRRRLQPDGDSVTLNDAGKLFTKDHDEEENVNYSNYRKGSRRRLTLKPKLDSFEASVSAPSDQNKRSLSGRNTRRQPSSSRASGGPASYTSPAVLNAGAHNVTASTSDSDTLVISESPESPGDAESKTSSTSVESSDDAESKTSSTSVDTSDDAEKQTSSTSVDSSTMSEDSESKDRPDMEEKVQSSSSSTPSPDEGDKKQRKKIKKRKGFFTRLMKSAPDEQWLLKVVLWFPVGIGMSVALYFLVIQKMNLQEKYKLIIGCSLGLVLSLTFAFSVQMRCVMTLVVPTFVGKAGRSYFAAFAIVYLVNGPITNIMDNCKEIVRSMTCNSALTANHTRAKYNLRMHPVEHALGDLMKDNFLIVRASRMIKKAFSPLTKEIKENENENRELESSIKDVEKMGNKKDSVVDKIDANYKDANADKDAGKKVEKQWEKKMDLRCQSTFSHGVQRCRDKMHQLEESCMDSLSFLGYLICWPLKITVFCELVKLIPGVVGMDCNSANQVSPGFGQTYVSARDVMDDMETGAKVNLQYKIVGSAEANYMPVEEMRQATIHEVKAKTDTINMTLNIITHFLTFTFLIVFYGAYKYNSKYLSDLNWDNKYITVYFRHIDARRKAREKRTLLPLKKAERKELYDPRKIKLSVAERKQLVKGSIKLVLRVIISAIICYMDAMFYQVLDIIARNSKIEYHQTGEHIVDIKIYGRGFMSALVRSFLERFNTKQNLDSLTTNYECLPRPSKTDMVIISFIFGTYMLVWVFMFFEAFGLRMRRAIGSFYYRKREKKRILFLYNERYRKRVGFLQHMRKKVRKQLREREFKRKIGLLLALKRQFPFLSRCLHVFKSAKDTCIICGETESKGFYTCPTEGCGVGYCRECWIDIKKKCYSCGQMSETEEDSGSDSETADDGDSSAEDSE